MSTVIEQIEQQIAQLSAKAVKKNTGTIRSVADGVAKVDGLSAVMYNEMVQFPGDAIGIALNLEEDEVGCVVLGDVSHLKEGDEVQTTGKLLSVPVGKALLGRVVDALGRPVDGKGPIDAKEFYPVERIAPGIIVRKSVSQPVLTGIMAIDSMIPIGRGQRELIIGDRGTGKTTIAIDTIINQARINRQGLASKDPAFRPLYSIYVAVGQKQSNIARTIASLEAAGALEYTIIVAAPAADNPANQYVAPYAGAAMGEWFMENNQDALIVYDDLSKHAVAYRQISLDPQAPVRPRGLSRATCSICIPACSSAPPRLARQGFADGPADHRNPRGRRLRLHSHERHLDHRRPDLPRDRPLQPGRAPGRVRRPLRLARRLDRPAEADQAGRRQAQGRARPVPRAGRLRPVRLRPRRPDQGPARSRLAHRRALQAAGVQSRFPSKCRPPCSGAMQNNYFDSDRRQEDRRRAPTTLKDFLGDPQDRAAHSLRQKGAFDDTLHAELKKAFEEWKGSYSA